jgi:carboxylate-amine ligase
LFLNSRGAIARFDRHAIEIRVIDIQECPQADMAVAEAVIAAVRSLTDEATIPLSEQQAWPEDLLADIFLRVVRDGEQAVIGDADYLAAMGIRERRMTAGAVWRILAERNSDRIAPEYQPALRRILTEGTLARRLVLRLGSRPDLDALMKAYRQLAACLAENRLWP